MPHSTGPESEPGIVHPPSLSGEPPTIAEVEAKLRGVYRLGKMYDIQLHQLHDLAGAARVPLPPDLTVAMSLQSVLLAYTLESLKRMGVTP